MENADLDPQIIACDRFGLIAPAINGSFPDASKSAYYRRIAETPVTLSSGKTINVAAKTLATWERNYRKFGLEGLTPHARSDSGQSRKIDDELAVTIQQLREKYPTIQATMLYELLIKEGHITVNDFSLTTLRQFMKNHPLDTESDVAKRERRAWEAKEVNDIWQADTLAGPPLDSGDKTYMQAILDDKSRKAIKARFVLADDALTFQGTLKDAIKSSGIPKKLYTDHGGSYDNDQLAFICARLGIELAHPKPYDAAAKGKIERFNRTCRMRFLSVLDADALRSLDALNDALCAWILTYNTTLHSSTGQTPTDCFLGEIPHLRFAPTEEFLDDAFLNHAKRKVARDATVRFNNQSFDVPAILTGKTCEILFDPSSKQDIWIVDDEGGRHRLIPTDKQANADGVRRPIYRINYTDIQ